MKYVIHHCGHCPMHRLNLMNENRCMLDRSVKFLAKEPVRTQADTPADCPLRQTTHTFVFERDEVGTTVPQQGEQS